MRVCTHTNSGATPAQNTKSFKKKALYCLNNIPDSKKISKLSWKISTGDAAQVQPPRSDVVNILTTLLMEKFLFATF